MWIAPYLQNQLYKLFVADNDATLELQSKRCGGGYSSILQEPMADSTSIVSNTLNIVDSLDNKECCIPTKLPSLDVIEDDLNLGRMSSRVGR